MKKKTLLIATVLILITGFTAYKYVFKGSRDIKSESADLSITALQLKADFLSNQKTANTKYTGEIIIVSGKITEKTERSITLDDGVICILSADEKNAIALNRFVKIKGKVDGYDDLFGQVKLTESSLTN